MQKDKFYMSEIQRIKYGNGNCYIVSNENNAVLVDTHQEKYREKILNACQRYNIKLIILTHGHFDHVQNAAFLSKALNAPVAMSKNDINLITNNMSQPLSSNTLLGKIVLSASMKGFNGNNIPFLLLRFS